MLKLHGHEAEAKESFYFVLVAFPPTINHLLYFVNHLLYFEAFIGETKLDCLIYVLTLFHEPCQHFICVLRVFAEVVKSVRSTP